VTARMFAGGSRDFDLRPPLSQFTLTPYSQKNTHLLSRLQTMASPRTNLLELPPEILRQISKEILGGDTYLQQPLYVKMGPITESYQEDDGSFLRTKTPYNLWIWAMPAMLSCRKLYQEISATFYTHQLFQVDLAPEQWPGHPRWTMTTRGMECTTEDNGRHWQEKFLQFHGSRINKLIFELDLVHNKTCSDPETMSNPIMNANTLIHVCGEPQCIMQTYTLSDAVEDCRHEVVALFDRLLTGRKEPMSTLQVSKVVEGRWFKQNRERLSTSEQRQVIEKVLFQPLERMHGMVENLLLPEQIQEDCSHIWPPRDSFIVQGLASAWATYTRQGNRSIAGSS
jgi:hypothetical protein